MRRVAVVICMLVVAGAIGAPGADARSCPNANTPATAASVKTMRAAVVCLINKQRTARRLPALRTSWRLDRSAQGWSSYMVSHDIFTHGADFASRITAVGFDWSWAGENIAAGFPTPRSVVNAWMASPDHCRNILSPNYGYVGTGVVARALGEYGPATWTQDFGLWMGQSPPSHNSWPANHCPYQG